MYFSKQSYKQRNTSKVIYTFIALGDTIIDTILTINFFTIQTQYIFPFYHSWKTITELHILDFPRLIFRTRNIFDTKTFHVKTFDD
jgi:hypothetical protein